MSTTIDSLQIEIQSNSSGAATNIRDLSKALGELKKNSSVNVAIKNLNNLSATLKNFAVASNATSSIGKLVGAMERLKSVGSIGGIGRSITKLSDALKGLQSVNVERVAPKIKEIAEAVAPLSAVKAGGINTMVNGLSKLGKVTESLDDETIEKFARKVELLSAKLEPLSTKMATIKAGFGAINSKARSAGSGISNMSEKVDGAKVNFSSLIYIVQSAVQALQQAIETFKQFIGEAIEWDGISARFGRGFGEQAQETYSWIQKLNEEMGINVQQFMQYSSIYANMLQGFGVATEDANTMALGYTELTYDIWAGYNDIYGTFAEASEAVKSAIAGEVEPIRRAGFTIVETQLEQTAANYGLKVSLESATEAQKSYLRYLTLVDQAHAQSLIGTYAKELSTAEGLMRTFSQQLSSLTQAFGSLFLPILVKVMPYLQAFVEWLTEGIQAIAALFGITIQGVDWSDYQTGVGGVTENTDNLTDSVGNATDAIKEMKNASIGIDELNVISPKTNSSGSSGTANGSGSNGFGGLDIDSVWDESILKDITDQVDRIKEKFEDWLPIIGTIGGLLGALSIVSLLENLGQALTDAGLLKSILSSLVIVTIEAALVFSFADNYLESGNLLYLIGQALVTAASGYLLYKAWGTNGLIMALGVSILAQLAAITLNVADGDVTMSDPELWIQSAFTTALAGVAGGILAYKGLIPLSTGQGIGLGLLAGLSLTLTAITIGEIAKDGEITAESLMTGLAGVLAAAGVGFMVGGPTGAMIAAGVTMLVQIVSATVAVLSEENKNSIKEDLDKRFGEIELSVSEIKVIIDKLMPDWSNAVVDSAKLYEGVEIFEEKIDAAVSTMAKYEWQVSVGIALSESDNKAYKTAIDNFITACQNYVSERGYALEIGLKATGASDSIVASANAISAAANTELERLGKKLQDTINAAYEDGLLDIDELEVINTIKSDMLEITNVLKDSNIQAEFKTLEMKWSGVELTVETFETMITEWDKQLDEVIKPALETTVKENLSALQANVAFAKLQLEKDPNNQAAKDMLADAEKALQEYIDSNPLESLTLEAELKMVTFATNSIKDAFKSGYEEAAAKGFFNYEINLADLSELPGFEVNFVGADETYKNLTGLIDDLMIETAQKLEGIDIDSKALSQMLKNLKPKAEDIEKIAAANREAGKTVTQSLREGLNDYYELKALTGATDGIQYQIGKGFSTDQAFLNTLATAENAGKYVDEHVREGLLNNIDYVTDSATGIVTGIKNSVTGETTYITPTLVKNFEEMGVKLGDALGGKYQYVYDETTGVLKSIVDSTTGNKVWVNGELKKAGEKAGGELSAGVKTGAETEMKKQEKSWKDWAIWPWNWFKEENEINSPSKLFEKGGKYLNEGLLKGVPKNSLKDRFSSAWTIAKDWWNKKKGELKKYTPSIGSIKDKVSSAWSSAKKWWDKSKSSLKSYTPSIGSIKDKLSSAWSTAKTWWNKNVKLSIPSLKFNVTYDTKGLSKVQKAVTKVLNLPGWPKLSFAANGGIFDTGSLIWAGERGPEVMANAGGGKTGVMNVQQMADAVYEGVYAAVMAANRASAGSGEQAVHVYLDGKEITKTVEKTQRERGTAILGNQVYSY